jgi:hypothetical protein
MIAIREIVEELRFGTRGIVTNLAVKIEPWARPVRGKLRAELGLRGYLLSRFGNDFGVGDRVKVLPDAEVADFFLWRLGPQGWFKLPAGYEKDRCVSFEVSGQTTGVLAVVDEAWKFWGAREWCNTGKGFLFYAAQHRKLGDRVLIVTQHVKQVDCQVPRVAEDFWVVKNHGKRKFGPFLQPKVFSVRVACEPITGGAQQVILETRTYRLDCAGLGSCWDTSAGVGMAGNQSADLGERRKGLHWSFAVMSAIGLGVLLLAGSRLFGKVVVGRMFSDKKGSVASFQANGTNTGRVFQSQPVDQRRTLVQPVQTNAVRIVEADTREVVGEWLRGNHPCWFLSDGSYLDPERVAYHNSVEVVLRDGHHLLRRTKFVNPTNQVATVVTAPAEKAAELGVIQRSEPQSTLLVIGHQEERSAFQSSFRNGWGNNHSSGFSLR